MSSISDSDDEILQKSIFDDSDENFLVGDLVWASWECGSNSYMWPAEIKKILNNGCDGYMVTFFCKGRKHFKVKLCEEHTDAKESIYQEKNQEREDFKKALELFHQKLEEQESACFMNGSAATSKSLLQSPRKRRNYLISKSCDFEVNEVVWSKYRNHPVWPSRVHEVINKTEFMISYYMFEEHAIRTSIKNIEKFDGPNYTNIVESGINSTLSSKFKTAYKCAYTDFKVSNSDSDLEFIPGTAKAKYPASPRKGKNQLVHFINKNEELFTKIASGKLVGHYHSRFKSSDPPSQSLMLGTFSKSELEEERILYAITQMQSKLCNRFTKLSPSYGINVILPEACIRLIMSKQKCTYQKAREIYEKDVNKISRKDKARAKESLLNTPISEDVKKTQNIVRNHKIKQLQSALSTRRKL